VHTLRARLGGFLIALATALAIVAIVMPLFLNPIWVAFEQGRADAVAWTGFTETDLRTATDAILVDLVVGPPDFDVQVDGAAVLNERERSHMRDVRTVFMGFFALTIVAVVAGAAIIIGRRGRHRAATWHSVRSGALGLIIGLVLVGGFAVISFDILFEVFHEIFFPGGSYTFDPATERLVQLFPFQFWQETAMILGVVAIIVAAVVAIVAHRRMVRAQRSGFAAPMPAGVTDVVDEAAL
jgi:integral membrane protein (TIGR01906 family)